MSESVQASGQGTSFKEVFYEDEITTEREQAEALKKLVPHEKYENVQEKIKELKASDLSEKFENLAKAFIFCGAVAPLFTLLLYLISSSIFNFEFSVGITRLLFSFAMFVALPLGAYNISKENKVEKQEKNDLQSYRKQLLNVFFNGNVIGEVGDLNKQDWRKIKVRENGKTETYMVRIKIDDKQLEHIESMKVVETDQ